MPQGIMGGRGERETGRWGGQACIPLPFIIGSTIIKGSLKKYINMELRGETKTHLL